MEEDSIDRSESGDENEIPQTDQKIIKFLDSADAYLTLINSLSSALRQGWLELASARHSMGSSRINSALFDLKFHSAASTLQVDDSDYTHLTLCKWAPSGSPRSMTAEVKFDGDELSMNKDNITKSSELQDKSPETNGSPRSPCEQAQKERLRSLSMFGMLVSPKLRAAQLSFETALETIVEIANTRALLLHAYDEVQNEMQSTTK